MMSTASIFCMKHKSIDKQLKKIEQSQAKLAEEKQQLLQAKQREENELRQLEKLVKQSGYKSAQELVEVLVEKYGLKLSPRRRVKKQRRRRTTVTAPLRDAVKKSISDGKTKVQVSKEHKISYVTVSKIATGHFDKLR